MLQLYYEANDNDDLLWGTVLSGNYTATVL